MKGLIPGENALVINARTNYGKKHLVGKSVTLIQRFAAHEVDEEGTWVGSCVIFPGKTFKIRRCDVSLWLIRSEGFKKNPEIHNSNIPDDYALLAEKHLMPIEPDDGLIEEFKRESDKLLEKA